MCKTLFYLVHKLIWSYIVHEQNKPVVRVNIHILRKKYRNLMAVVVRGSDWFPVSIWAI